MCVCIVVDWASGDCCYRPVIQEVQLRLVCLVDSAFAVRLGDGDGDDEEVAVVIVEVGC